MPERSGTYENTDKVTTTTTPELTQLINALTQAFKQAHNQEPTPLEGTALIAANKFGEVLIRLGLAPPPENPS